MYRTSYDTDITTWSPNGKLFQVDYAMEAVKQGSCTAGAVSKTHAVVVALKRSPDKDVSSHLSKLFLVDKHIGMGIAGLTPDARSLARFMRQECINHRYTYGNPMPVERVVRMVADKSQECTQVASRRPYGVGLLVIGCDDEGPKLFQTCPSGNYYQFHGQAIGARSQAARTYLERHYESFPDASLAELRLHCLKALAASTGDDQKLTPQNTAICQVGIDTPFTMFDDAVSAKPFVEEVLAVLEQEAQADDDGEEDAADMQDE